MGVKDRKNLHPGEAWAGGRKARRLIIGPAPPKLPYEMENARLRSPLITQEWYTRIEARERHCLATVLIVYGALVLFLGLGRSYLGYVTETDFIGVFVPDAQRFLAGEPLQSSAHPPLYPMLIGALYSLIGDWLTAGVLLSFLSSLVALLASYLLFLRLGGRAAAWGAVLALLGASVFVKYSALATSDVFFQALFVSSCLFAATAAHSGSRPLWWVCGITAGLGAVSRANGLTLVLFMLAPLFYRAAGREKIAHCLFVAAGFALPVILILVYGASTGSRVFPSNTHVNLAVTYFSGSDAVSWNDKLSRVDGRFDSLSEVLLHNPLLIAKTYATDLFDRLVFKPAQLMEPPLYFFFVPGLFFLIGMRLSGPLIFLLGAMLAQLLLVNFKGFDHRFYLFLIPLMGAGVGEMCSRIVRWKWPSSRRRRWTAALIAMMFLMTSGLAAGRAYFSIRNQTEELREAVPVALEKLGAQATLLADRPHLSYYTNAKRIILPDLKSLHELQAALEEQRGAAPVYLFYGSWERRIRPQYLDLQHPQSAPKWLQAIAWGKRTGSWVLYRYQPSPDRPRAEDLTGACPANS